jgi:cell division septum initiation protein DivIVA
MTDDQSIFETAKGTSPFPIARRGGYDPNAVDAWARNQVAELARSGDVIAELRANNEALQKQIGELSEQMETVGQPTYAALGGHAAQLLKLSEQEAADVRTRARREADDLVTSAQEEADALLSAATVESENLRANALTDVEAHRKRIQDQTVAANAEAVAFAEDLRAQAQREATQIKYAAEQEAETARQGAERDVEQARASADREVTEARRVLAVEKERLAREANDFHTAAAEQTSKLVADAEARAAAADDRAREAMAQAASARESASTDAARMIEEAETHAKSILAQVRAEADLHRTTAAKDLERQTRSLRTELADLQERRAAILAQLGQIRDIVGGFAVGETNEVAAAETLAENIDDAIVEAVEAVGSDDEAPDDGAAEDDVVAEPMPVEQD